MRLQKYLTELFKTDINLDIKYKMSTSFGASFIVGDIEYAFHASSFGTGEEGWHISFTANKELKNGKWVTKTTDRESIIGIGGGAAVQVFSAIIKLFKYFIKTYNPDRFYFYGKEKSRQKLYDRFAKMIARQGNYRFMKYTDPEWSMWGKKYDFVKE